MPFAETYSIRRKLTLLMVLVSGAALLVAAAAMMVDDYFTLRSSKAAQLTAIADVLASNSTAAISFGRQGTAEELLASLANQPTIEYACLFDSEGNVFASYPSDADSQVAPPSPDWTGHQFARQGYLEIALPVIEDQENLGTIYLRATMRDLYTEFQQDAGIALVVMFASLVVAVLISAGAQRVISAPILELATAAARITEEGDFSIRVEPRAKDEIGTLYHQFNQMLDRIQTGEERLRAERDHSAGIIRGLPVIVCGISPDGRTNFINPAGERITRYSQEELVGRNWWETFYPGEAHAQVDRLLESFKKGPVHDHEMVLKDRDGNEHAILWNSMTRLDEDGNPIELIGFGNDITDRKRAEAERTRLAKILEVTSDMVGMATPEGRTIYLNSAGKKMLGWPDDLDVMTSSISDQHPAWALEVIRNEGLPTAARDGTWTGETSLLHRDGREIPASQVITCHKSPDGEVEHFSTIIRDITERKQSEIQVRQLRNYLKNVIDSMPSVLVSVDVDGKVTQWNLQAERMAGLPTDQAQGRLLGEVFPQLADEMEKVRDAIREGSPRRDEKVVQLDGGKTRFADVTIYPLVSNGVEGAVIRVDDVTERVRMEELMIQSEKMLSVGGLAAGMAHEINNPLAGILQNIQVVQDRTSTGLEINEEVAAECGTTLDAIGAYMKRRRVDSMLEAIRESGSRAAKIVDNMLSFSRKSSSEVDYHNPGNLLDQTIDLAANDYDLRKKYDFRKVEIVRQYEPGLNRVPCEGTKIQQVLLNLLKNGAHAMAEQENPTEPPRLILRTMRDGQMARIEVEDNGTGMDEATRKRVFEPFFTTKEVGVGTGLGLSVSYFIITENHHGTMAVESTSGRGSKFIIRLPLQRDTK